MLNNTPLPEIFIGKTLVNQRILNYQENKHGILSNALAIATSTTAKPETKSIWYSKEHVQTWLDEMNLMNADGIRFYFAAYGVEEDVAQAGQLCLVAVLTSLDNNNHKDIIYEDAACYGERLLATNSRDLNLDDVFDKEKPKEFNYGSLCPPACASMDSAFPLAEES